MSEKMPLSQAIRLGSMLGPQAFGVMFAGDATCAQGAAVRAINAAKVSAGAGYALLFERWPELSGDAVPLNCGYVGSVYLLGSQGMIAHLNDIHKWTRECIADFVETIERAGAPVAEPAHAPETQKNEPALVGIDKH